MLSYKSKSITQYLNQLAAKKPVPGGGSAAALVATLGVALVCMVANYSTGKSRSKSVNNKIKDILKKSERIKKRLLQLVDLDTQVYLRLAKTRRASKEVKRAALKEAQEVPREVCRLCYKALKLTPFLVQKGNLYLLSDIRIAVEFLLAAFNASLVNIEVNQ